MAKKQNITIIEIRKFIENEDEIEEQIHRDLNWKFKGTTRVGESRNERYASREIF